jgi:hypothetical protein
MADDRQLLEELRRIDELEAKAAGKSVGKPSVRPEEGLATRVAGGAVEPLLHLGTGAVAGPLSGLAGIVGSILPGPEGQGAKWAGNVGHALTYEPKTQGGKDATDAITYPLQKFAEGADYVGANAADMTGSPAIGAAVNAAMQLAPALVGAKNAPKGMKSSVPGLDAVVEAPGKAAAKIAKVPYRAIEPILPGGPEAIYNRYKESELVPAAPTQRQMLIDAIRDVKELTPGSKPTVQEAVSALPEGTSLAAHQRAVSKTPEISSEFIRRDFEQQGARKAAIEDFAGTPESLAALEGTRAGNAKVNYEEAGSKVVKADAELQALLETPALQKAFGPAKDIAGNNQEAFSFGQNSPEKVVAGKIVDGSGTPLSFETVPATLAEYPVQSLHYLKLGLDDMIRNPERFALGSTEAHAIKGVRDKYVAWLDKKSSEYNMARGNFALDSKPINVQQTGQYLLDKLEPPLDIGETAGSASAFARAAKDASGTIKSATGRPVFGEGKLTDAIGPDNAAVVDAVVADLSRKAQGERLGRGTNLSGASKVGEPPQLPRMLSTTATLVNAIMRKFGESADSKINKIAGEQYLDPAKFLESLDKTSTKKLLIEAITRQRNAALVGGAIAEGERN